MTDSLPEIVKLHQDQIPEVLKEIEDAFYDIPFENSQHQTENFVIAASITPARAYRAIGLRMSSKIRALQDAQFGRMREDIDIEELQAKIEDRHTSNFDRRRAEIDIQQKLTNRSFSDKLINDALAELNILYHHFKHLPKYTREQFEQEEQLHFTERLSRQIGNIQGATESLVNMTGDMPAMIKFEQEYTNQLLLGTDPDKAIQLALKGDTNG